MKLGDLPKQEQIRRLTIILNPRRSKLRPYLALFGIKNYVLLRNGQLLDNNPSVSWYTQQLAIAGISQNRRGVRDTLKLMARLGIFNERHEIRPVSNPIGSIHRLTRTEVCEFYLDERIFNSLCLVLQDIFKVESLSHLLMQLQSEGTHSIKEPAAPRERPWVRESRNPASTQRMHAFRDCSLMA